MPFTPEAFEERPSSVSDRVCARKNAVKASATDGGDKPS
jgi:hypothetical protein